MSTGRPTTILLHLLVVCLTLGATVSCNRSSSSGGPRQRFVTFNPSTGIFHSVDIFPRDAVFQPDTRDLGAGLDGYAAAPGGSVAIVYESLTSFLIFVSYADPTNLALATTDIGNVAFEIGDAELSDDGSTALFSDANSLDVQLLDLSNLGALRYSMSFRLDEAFAGTLGAPDSSFFLLFPETSRDRLALVDTTNFADPLQEFLLPNTEAFLSFDFLDQEDNLAFASERNTGQVLTFNFEDARVSGEIVADALLLGDTDIRSVSLVPGERNAYVGFESGDVTFVNFTNPFRIFPDPAAAVLTGVEGSDLLVSVSPDGRFLLVSADGSLEIFDITNRTLPTLLRRFNLGGPVLEIGYNSEDASTFASAPTPFVVVGGNIHLIDLTDRSLPALSPPTTFPAFTSRVTQQDPAGARISGTDAGGSILYLSITLREEDAPRLLGTFGVSPALGSGFEEPVFFVR